MAPPPFNRRGGHNRNGAGTKAGVPGSRIPQRMLQEVKDQETEEDKRTFKTHYVNGAAQRKELRKQKRQAKGKRKEQFNHRQQQDISSPSAKRQKTKSDADISTKNSAAAPTTAPSKTPKQPTLANTRPASKIMDEKKAIEKLSVSNPHLYSLLASEQLLTTDTEAKGDFEEDDRAIAYWEKKLKMGKNKKLGKAFEEDGLLDLLGEEGDVLIEEEDVDKKYLMQKRAKANQAKKSAQLEEQTEMAMDDMFADLDNSSSEEEGEEDLDLDEDEDLDLEGLEEESESEEIFGEEDECDDSESVAGNDKEDKHISAFSSEEEEEEEEEEIKQKSKEVVATKYVPPHLRKATTTKSEQQIRLQRLLQGLFNRLSESNMESILADIEKSYGNYPRNDVTTTITDIILTSIAQKANLLDSFVIIYATIVGSLYRLVGVDFAAHFVQTMIEMFEKNNTACRQAILRGDIGGDEGPMGSKESKNLLTLTIELYNFQVISSVLIFDLVRLFIAHLDEQSVEHLLKIIKTCGPQMRTDDPASLKDIIDEIQKETAKRDAKTISTRHKFMLETIANIKNNKIRNSAVATGQGDKELVMKMKKYLNGIGKKRTVRSSEPLRVSLEDIHQIETKGKWWLVGASWKDNLVGTESNMLQAKILDAFENLLKLSLTEVQQREISRVLLQCTGNEKTFNPFYMLVSKKLCEYNHSFRVTYQYCLWDFLRDLGESGVGGLDRVAVEAPTVADAKNIRLSRIVNVAKFYAYLIANSSLSLAILKSVNFMTLTSRGRLFLEVLFANICLQTKEGGVQSVANVFGKIHEMRTLSQGCIFFMHEVVIPGKNSGLSDQEMETVREGCKIARQVLSK